MKKLILAALAAALWCVPNFAQGQNSSLSNPVGGAISVSGANCAVANVCVWQKLPSTATTTTVTITGTFSATLIVESSADGGTTWTQQSSQTAPVVVTFTTTSFTDVRVRCSAFVSGTASVNIQTAGNQINVTVNSSSGGAGSLSTVIDTTASKYATPVGHVIQDATLASGSNIIDCTFSNDCNFVAGNDNGATCFATSFTVDTSIITTPSVVILPEGTLTVTDAQHATCSGGNATATATHASTFVWGKLGHTQLNSAWTDCIAANGCDFQLPGGPVLVESAVGVVPSTNATYIIAQGYGRISVRGWGASVSLLIPTPNFPSASCVGGPSTDLNGCFFSAPSLNMSDFGIFGAGQGAIGAGFNGKVGIIINGFLPVGQGANSYINSVDLFSWGATTSGFTGVRIEGESGTTFHDVHNDGFGAINCDINQSASNATVSTTFEGTYCAVGLGPSLLIRNKGTFSSHGGVYGFNSGSGLTAVQAQDTVIANFSGDVMPYQVNVSSLTPEFYCLNAAICTLDGVYINNPTAGGGAITDSTTGGIYSTNSQIIGIGAGITTGGAADVFYSLGGNKISGGSNKAVNLASFGGKFASNPTDTITGTFADITPTCAITGAGTTATCTAFGQNESMVVNIASSGTGQTTTGTLTVTFSGSGFSPGLTGATNIFCTPTLSNASAAWATSATIFSLSRSATNSTFTWVNGASALVAANTYQIVLSCRAS